MATAEQKKDSLELHADALERWKKSNSAEADNRQKSLEDILFVNGEQWPADIVTKRTEEGRPCLTINRLPGFIDQVVGDQRQNRPRIKVRPVDSKSDVQLAEIIEGIVRNIEYISGAETVYDTAFEQAVTGGFGYFRVLKRYADDDTFDQDIFIEGIKNPFSVYFDPNAKKHDYSDAKYAFICEDMPEEVFKARFPKATASTFEKGVGEGYSDWYSTDIVRVAEYWAKKPVTKTIVQLSNGMVMAEDDATEEKLAELAGPVSLDEMGQVALPEPVTIVKSRTVQTHKVCQYFISAHEILEGPNEWDGKYIPIIPVLGKEIIVDGKRVLRGLIRHAKDSQRMYNYWRTTVTELVALAPKAPWLLTPNQIKGHEKMWASSNVTTFPYLLWNFSTNEPAPTRIFPASVPQGAFTEAQVAVDDMKATTGIYDASLGNRGNETSGKAIIARQKEGDVATYAFIDNLSRSIAYTGKIILDLLPKVYDTERIVRIRNIDDTEKFIPVNKAMNDEFGNPLLLNDITVGKYDVVVETGPSYSTARTEAAESMIAFVQAVPNSAPLISDLIAKNMDWPGASEIAERLQKTLPPGLADTDDGNPAMPPQPPQPSPRDMLEMKKIDLENKKIDFEAWKLQGMMQGSMPMGAMNGR